MKIGDLVKMTRNTKKEWGTGIVFEKHLYEPNDYLLRVYWFGIRKVYRVFENDHHVILLRENDEK